jgi:hypothetical protein
LTLDVTLDAGAAIPEVLKHRFEIAVSNTPPSDTAGDHDPAPRPSQEITFVGHSLQVGPREPVLPTLSALA